MLQRVLTVLCAGFMAVLMASCGQTYELQSITVTPATGYNLETAGQIGQLTVTANYSNTKTNVVTQNSSYQLGQSTDPNAPLSVGGVPTVTVNKSGTVAASSSVGACTWTATLQSDGTTYTYATQPFPVTVTYAENGVTAQTSVPISLATAAGCYDGVLYPAPPPSSSVERGEAAESFRPR